jgi:hypothetical protein
VAGDGIGPVIFGAGTLAPESVIQVNTISKTGSTRARFEGILYHLSLDFAPCLEAWRL